MTEKMPLLRCKTPMHLKPQVWSCYIF